MYYIIITKYLIFFILTYFMLPVYSFEPQFTITTLWESDYEPEGGDVETIDIVSFDTSITLSGFKLEAWTATGYDETYQEHNIYFGYEVITEPIEAYLGYTWLEYPREDLIEIEYNAGLAFTALPYITTGFDYSYSSEADIEVFITSEFNMLEESFSLEPFVLAEYQAGDKRTGPANLEFGIDMRFALTKEIDLLGSIGYIKTYEQDKKDARQFQLGLSFDY